MTDENQRRRERYASDPEYAEKKRAQARAWGATNRERKNAVEQERRLTGKKNEQNRAWHSKNPTYAAEYAKGYRKANAAKLRDYYYRRRYGISAEEHDRRLDEQSGVCAICKGAIQPVTRIRRLCVDHDHQTGVARGLLCDVCNRVIGMMKDDPNLLREAAAYLESRKGSS